MTLLSIPDYMQDNSQIAFSVSHRKRQPKVRLINPLVMSLSKRDSPSLDPVTCSEYFLYTKENATVSTGYLYMS